jgi:hypothetical protein
MRLLDLPQRPGDRPSFLGLAEDGARLLLPFARDEHRAFRDDKRARGIVLQRRQLELGDERHWYLDVVCARAELRWLFSTFVADILLRIEREPDKSCAAITRSCFSAWRALFAGSERQLTPKQLAGLFGELTLLEVLLGVSQAAVACWRGPYREPHDFVGTRQHIEVKTTLSSEDDVVHIHGLEQLTSPDDGPLHLAHLRVEMPSEHGLSVPSLVDRLREQDTTGRLGLLLPLAGYHESHRSSYEEVKFELVGEQWYAVDGAFPRLTAETFPEGHVPPGLSGFGYSLDLSAAGVPPLPADEVAAAIGAMFT